MAGSLYDIALLSPLIQEGRTLLTPNQRLARRIKTQWDRQQARSGAGTWPRLPVYPVAQWLEQCWRQAVEQGSLVPRLQLGVGQELHLWREIIRQEAQRSDTYHLLRVEDAAEIAQQARQTLHLWQLDLNEGPLRTEFERDPDCRVFLSWLTVFEDRLRESGQLTGVDCLRELLQLDSDAVSRTAGVALVECGRLPPLQAAVIERLSASVIDAPIAGSCAERLLHPFPDRRSELQAVARWAAQTSRQAPDKTFGLVLDEAPAERVALEYLLRREFDCLGDDYDALPVNFSTGIPLAHAPLVRDALAVLSLGGYRVRMSRVVTVLQSRFVNLPDAGSPLAQRFIQDLYAGGRDILEVSDLRYQASEAKLGEQRGLQFGKYLLDMYQVRELRQRAMPSTWVTLFQDILDLWGWPGSSLDSLEFQQAGQWAKTLDTFRGFDAVSGPLDFGAALELLRDSCQRAVSHPKTVDANVQVLGPLEAIGLSFDHLWLVGMQASSWPAPARPNPFLPMQLQSRLDMPRATPAHEWNFAQTRLAQYLRSCGTVHASYSQQIDGIPDLPSPLLQTFAEQPLQPLPAISTSWSDAQQHGDLIPIADDEAPALAAEDIVSGGSALLEDQSHCPFRAFARRRLRIEPLGEVQVALSAADRGNLLHDALYTFWGEIGNYAELAALDSVGQTALIKRAVDVAVEIARRQPGPSPGQAYWELESDRLEGLLQEWLQVERQREAFTVFAREEKVDLVLDQLELRLRVDRVDVLEDGSRVIIDYKSSKSRLSDWMGERPRKPQLLLYCIAEPGEVAALSFAQVRPGECAYVGMGHVEVSPGIKTDLGAAEKAGMAVENWQALNEYWRDTLVRLAAEFVAGNAQVDPLAPDSCTWCGLQPLCRIDRDDTPAESAT